MSPGNGSGSGSDREGDEKQEGERFADLLGSAKPLKGAAPRAAPPSPDKKHRAPRAARDDAPTPRFRWPDSEQPRLAAAPGVNDRRLRALSGGKIPPDERIDLHGVRADAAPSILTQRLESARARGLTCVVVIHGKGSGSGSGEAVLREGLPGWLTSPRTARSVLAFAPAPAALGGDGATLVLLSNI
jgi:DNA-nicking Smr family endonuclease